MTKRKLRSVTVQSRSKRIKRSPPEANIHNHDEESNSVRSPNTCRLLSLPVELLDTIVQLVINEPAERRLKRKFFHDKLYFLQCLFDTNLDYEHDAERNGICEDDQSMNEILRRSIFRASRLLRHRAHDYVFRHRAWIRIATKTPSLHAQLHLKIPYLNLCSFAQENIVPSDLATFDVFVGGSTPAASYDRVFKTSKRSYIFPFFFKSWLEICAALRSMIWDDNKTFRPFKSASPGQLSLRCTRTSPALQKLLDTQILPPLLSLRGIDDIHIAGPMLKHIKPTSLNRMHDTLSTMTSDVEDLQQLQDNFCNLKASFGPFDSALFALFADAHARHVADRWLGSRYFHYAIVGPTEWTNVDDTTLRLKKALCEHNYRVGLTWYDLAVDKGMHWLRAQKRLEVAGHYRWCNPDHRVLFGLPRKDRAKLHLAGGLAKQIGAWDIVSNLVAYGNETPEDDATLELRDGVVQMSIAANLQPDLTRAHELYRIMKAEVDVRNIDEDELEIEEPDGYVEVHDVAGGGFCWAGSQLTLQDMGGSHFLLPWRQLYEFPDDDTTSPRCGKVCNCILI